MRVTFVLPTASLAGGIRVVAIYAMRLAARGHQVFVVSVPPKPPRFRARVKSALMGMGGLLSRKPAPSHLDGLPVEHFVLEKFRPVVDADVPDADVVIATWWATAEWVAALRPSKGAKVHFIQGDDREWFPAFPQHELDRIAATWRLPMHHICVSSSLRDLIVTEGHDPDAFLVPNSVDTAQFDAPARGRQSSPTVGVIYSTAPNKGCDIALEAVRLASASIPDLKLITFGANDPEPSMPLPPGASFTPRPAQDKIKEVYSRCDFWLFTSRSEGFGLPILEAMACRTPVIATPVGAAPELLAGGGGVLMKPEDGAQAIAEVIQREIGQSDQAWRRMSDAAYATAHQYNWEAAAVLFEAALQRAIERAARGEVPGRVASGVLQP